MLLCLQFSAFCYCLPLAANVISTVKCKQKLAYLYYAKYRSNFFPIGNERGFFPCNQWR